MSIISFANPLALALLAVPLVMAVLGFRARGHPLVLPLAYGTPQPWWHRWPLMALLATARLVPALAATVAGLLLAEPRRFADARPRRPLTNIEFCLDVSLSMSWRLGNEGGGDRRYDLAMKQVNKFIEDRKGDSFGLTVFGVEAFRWSPPTSDPAVIQGARPFFDPEKLSRSLTRGTNIGGALESAARSLEQHPSPESLILLITDGEDNRGLDFPKACALSARLAERRTKVCVVIIAHPQVPSLIATVAEGTGGVARTANDPEALNGAFRTIEKLSRAEEVLEAQEAVAFDQPFAVIGLVLTGLGLLCLFGLRGTPW